MFRQTPAFRLFLPVLMLAWSLVVTGPQWGPQWGAQSGIGRAAAQEAAREAAPQPLVLRASPALIDSGFLAFLMPRFSLKTGIDITVQPIAGKDIIPTDADIALILRNTASTGGTIVITQKTGDGATRRYALILADQVPPGARRFARWLTSPIGQRTIAQFRKDGRQPFAPPEKRPDAATTVTFTGDTQRGENLAYLNCGRCHVIGPRNRMAGIGSTPSFSALRALGNWRERFSTFFDRNPHPAVVVVKDLSRPRVEAHTTPMSPVVITRDEFKDILAFVAALEPADLGAPVAHQ